MCTDKKCLMASMMALALSSGFALEAEAGCRINYSFQNNSNAEIYTTDQQVKSKGGTWTELFKNTPTLYKANKALLKAMRGARYGGSNTGYNSLKFEPGGKVSGVYSASFSCKAKRRYRFIVSDGKGCQKNIYYPSATGWTTSTDINFGDISRHCKQPTRRVR